MIKIRSLLKEDDFDLSDNPLKNTIPSGQYIFYRYTDSGRDFGSNPDVEIKLEIGDPKKSAIETLKEVILSFLVDNLDNNSDIEDEDELKNKFIQDEYWFIAQYASAGFWEVIGMEQTHGQFHGPKSEFARLFLSILKKESKDGDEVYLSDDNLKDYFDEIYDIDSWNYDILQEIKVKEGGFGEFVDYVMKGGDPERFNVGKILTNG